MPQREHLKVYVKRQPAKWEKIFENPIYNMGLIFKIHEQLNLPARKQNAWLKNKQEIQTDISHI